MVSRRCASEPTPGSLADVQAEADPEQVARTVVLRRLTAAPRTRQELAEDLWKRGIPDDVVQRVLTRFVDVGLIDDGEYARMWVSSRQRSRGSARSVLRQELRAKGIDDDSVRAALEEIDDETERRRAMELVRARLASTARLEPQVRLRRLVGMLVRRGYRQSVAVGVVREAIGEEEPGWSP